MAQRGIFLASVTGLALAMLANSGCALPTKNGLILYYPEGQGGKAFVEAYRLPADPDWNNLSLKPQNERTPVDRMILIPFYVHRDGGEYTVHPRAPIVTGNGEHFELLADLGFSNLCLWPWTGGYNDGRPKPGAMAFTAGSFPVWLGESGDMIGAFPRKWDESEDYPWQPPKGCFVRFTCVFRPLDTVDRQGAANNADNFLWYEKEPAFMQLMGVKDPARFFSLVDGSWELTDADRLMIYEQLVLVANFALEDEFKAKYVAAIRTSRGRLEGKVAEFRHKLGKAAPPPIRIPATSQPAAT